MLHVEEVSRVGICLSRCSLRENSLPQWQHQIDLVVGSVPSGIALGKDTPARLRPTSGGRSGSAGGRISAV